MAAPTFQAVGTFQAGTAVQLTVPWPAHAVDDIGILVIESSSEIPNLATASGFVEIPGSGQTTTGLFGRVFWCRATSTSMADVVTGTATNHNDAVIVTARGCITTGDPWDVISENIKGTTSTATSITGDTSTVAETLIQYIAVRSSDQAANQYSGEADATVTGLAERVDNGTQLGNGGGIGYWTATKATAGAYGPMTATLANTTLEVCWSIALKPPAGTINEAAATVAGVATVTGNLTRILQAQSSPAGVGTVSSNLEVTAQLNSTVAGVATVTGNLTQVLGGNVTIVGVATVTANGSQNHQLAVSTIGAATVTVADLDAIVEVKARTVLRIQ